VGVWREVESQGDSDDASSGFSDTLLRSSAKLPTPTHAWCVKGSLAVPPACAGRPEEKALVGVWREVESQGDSVFTIDGITFRTIIRRRTLCNVEDGRDVSPDEPVSSVGEAPSRFVRKGCVWRDGGSQTGSVSAAVEIPSCSITRRCTVTDADGGRDVSSEELVSTGGPSWAHRREGEGASREITWT
jgi:hypothetical protein